MSSVGIDRVTGRVLTDWQHTLQSLSVLFTTNIGSRVMRRLYGSLVPRLLGENLTYPTILRFVTAVIVAVELWEPRFRIKRVRIVQSENSPETLRKGALRLAMIGEYRPRGHLGDPTPDYLDRTIYLGGGGSVSV
ncbi:MAG: baseplate assembly protein [Chelatococcus sp.]|nr:MAG: baseplate assembly protein [Chelatococcus sp.]